MLFRSDRIAALFLRLGFRKLLEELDLPSRTSPVEERGERISREWKRAEGVDDLIATIGGLVPLRTAVAASEENGKDVAVAVRDRGVWILPESAVPALFLRAGGSGGTIYLYEGKTFLRRCRGIASDDEDPRLFDLQIAAHLLEAADEDIRFADGVFTIAGTRAARAARRP